MSGVDVMKKLKGEAKRRQKTGNYTPAKNKASERRFEPSGKFFVSSNWKRLLENRPNIAPKAAADAATAQAPDGGAAQNIVALDCEMVGTGPAGSDSRLARVSIVDHEGRVLIDRYVRPSVRITDYRSKITGITAATLEKPGVLPEHVAIQQASDLLRGKIVVGHSVNHDFDVLGLDHPHVLIRDTSTFRPLRPVGRERKTPSLKALAEHWLQLKIHDGSHDSVVDARTALRLYRLKSKQWEKQLRPAMEAYGSPGSAGAAGVSAPVSRSGGNSGRAGATSEDLDDDGSEGEPVARSDGRSAGNGQALAVEGPMPRQNKGKKARLREKRLAAAAASSPAAKSQGGAGAAAAKRGSACAVAESPASRHSTGGKRPGGNDDADGGSRNSKTLRRGKKKRARTGGP
eukprot:TRINITY_DN9512_c0_g1_i3.p1 TRINITY_DN9512_c0_g1~~TRINITY_DN9512_c0_g1_i3.p1  ORF type:complete len:416 (+),score=78.43 TRINITY_DN9512_c0_g1_i3:41-1249(+)